jgi:hypothetical protein
VTGFVHQSYLLSRLAVNLQVLQALRDLELFRQGQVHIREEPVNLLEEMVYQAVAMPQCLPHQRKVMALFRNPQASVLLVDDEVDEVIDMLDPRPSHMLIYLKSCYHPPARRTCVETLLRVHLQESKIRMTLLFQARSILLSNTARLSRSLGMVMPKLQMNS